MDARVRGHDGLKGVVTSHAVLSPIRASADPQFSPSPQPLL